MQSLFQNALRCHQAGQFDQAEALYRQILGMQPGSAQVRHLLGLVAYQRGDYGQAVGEIGRAIELDPRQPDYYNNLGLALRAQGDPERAVAAYRQALALTPRDADLHNNLGNALHALGRHEEAIASFRTALALQPDAAARFNLGNVLFDQGAFVEAEQQFRQAAEALPDDPDIRNNLGNTLRELGRLEEAAAEYRATLRLRPGYPAASRHLGWLMQELGRPQEAMECYRLALQADPGDAAACYNLGNSLRDLGRSEEALAVFEQGRKLAPQDADLHNNLGNVLRELGRLGEALDCYREALRLDPQLHHARAHLLHQCQHACDWRELEAQADEVRRLVREEPAAQIAPFAMLAVPGVTEAEQLRCAQNWVAGQYANYRETARRLGFEHARQPGRKIRIGYLSADFHEHATAYLMAEVFELHDRDAFEICAYSYGPDDSSPMRARLEKAFDRFADIRSDTAEAAARRIHADAVDILVDLKGYTAHTRSEILALRPAPLQVNYLGYPGTMGADFVDYLIGDPVVTPPRQAQAYSECLALLPNAYQPNDRKRSLGARPTRASCGLPDQGFVFCGFNQAFKILPETFAVWMRLLQSVPGSVLWLLEPHPLAQENLRREAAEQGVDPARIVFAPRLPQAAHLARQQLADLLLDTLPYNAHTTASDALWCGVPVVTCRGDSFAARVAASLLSAAGLPELVTGSLADYETLARRLATHPAELDGLRRRLLEGRESCALFDTVRFARALERLYRKMWERYSGGQPPGQITAEP